MNIKNIERTLLFDNINSSMLKLYKDNWNKTINKELELYSVYKDYFEKDDYYLVYLGVTDNNEHYFYKLCVILESVGYQSNFSATNIKLINKNLLAVTISTNPNTILYKKVKCTKEEEDKIFNIIKDQYDETPINSLNIGSIKFNTVGSTSWTSSYNNINFNDLSTDIKNLKNDIKDIKNSIKTLNDRFKKMNKKTP